MEPSTVTIGSDGANLTGDIAIPPDSAGVVLFAHGSGSSRHSPRNRAVASHLNHAGFGAVLVDLLTEDEDRTDARTGKLRFDVGLLTRRLVGAIDSLAVRPETRQLRLGLFGASTGAAGALEAATQRPASVFAVVSRGGRPDLAAEALDRVTAPVLLIVGGRDEVVIGLNQRAAERLRAPCEVRIVPDATHLFEEPGALEQVAELASDWFGAHLHETT